MINVSDLKAGNLIYHSSDIDRYETYELVEPIFTEAKTFAWKAVVWQKPKPGYPGWRLLRTSEVESVPIDILIKGKRICGCHQHPTEDGKDHFCYTLIYEEDLKDFREPLCRWCYFGHPATKRPGSDYFAIFDPERPLEPVFNIFSQDRQKELEFLAEGQAKSLARPDYKVQRVNYHEVKEGDVWIFKGSWGSNEPYQEMPYRDEPWAKVLKLYHIDEDHMTSDIWEVYLSKDNDFNEGNRVITHLPAWYLMCYAQLVSN